MRKDLLTLGTLVKLSNISEKVLIIGFRGIDDRKIMFDYIGLVYPYGFIDRKNVLLFNNSDVERILYDGYMSQEEIEFKNEINNVYYSNDGDKQ